jgi:3-deoxy-manno-octulosonate cytidylyltransferase (CMP-KDO synthetase)
MTSPDHASGTSRLAEAARRLALEPDEIVVNAQGDEPEMEPSVIDATVAALRSTAAPVATAAASLAAGERIDDPNIVKVVVDANSCAMYFSRAPIPFVREPGGGPTSSPLRHIGLYAYRRSFLDAYLALQPTLLERTEMLEQLRVLYHGHKIVVAMHQGLTRPGIDTPEQYEAFVQRWRARSQG